MIMHAYVCTYLNTVTFTNNWNRKVNTVRVNEARTSAAPHYVFAGIQLSFLEKCASPKAGKK